MREWLSGIAYRLRRTRNTVVWFLTPPSLKRKLTKGAWAKTLLKDWRRAREFHEKFGDWEKAFDVYWNGKRKTTEASKRMDNWQLNDIFEMAVIGQLNEQNFLRDLFKRNPLYGMEGKTTFKVNPLRRKVPTTGASYGRRIKLDKK